jgi:Binding-protein-dependent transport system inner membrane component
LSEDTVGVLALGLQTLPSVCWVPLALLWFGQTEGAMLCVVIMGTVWSVVIAADPGVRTIPPIFARAARTMGSGPFHRWLHVILPASLPYLISGMKQGWAFAWRSLMTAEIYVTILTGFGLGYFTTLRPRTECDGSSNRDHVGHRCNRFIGRQNPILALGAFSSPPLGHGANLSQSLPIISTSRRSAPERLRN